MKDQEAYHLDGSVPETPANPGDAGAWTETTVVGTRLPRVDAYERVSGTAVYPSDVFLPDMLHGAILAAPTPTPGCSRVDTSKAAKMPGVRAVLTADTPGADLPWYEQGGQAASRLLRPPLPPRGRGGGGGGGRDAATRPPTPLRAIEVEYEVLPFVIDDEEALAPGAPAGPRGRQPGRRAVGPRARRRRRRLRRGRRRGRANLPHARARSTPRWSRTARSPAGTATGSPSGTPPRASTASSRASPAPSACRWPTCG